MSKEERQLLAGIKYVLTVAKEYVGRERKIYLETAFDLMRQYQGYVEATLGLDEIRCGHCGRYECSH